MGRLVYHGRPVPISELVNDWSTFAGNGQKRKPPDFWSEGFFTPIILELATIRRDGREDEGDGLENRYTGNCIVGSNPTPSARQLNAELAESAEFYRNQLKTSARSAVNRMRN